MELIGAILNNYRITQHLVRGGMAEIYLAEQQETGELVAVKMVRDSSMDHFERFRREVKTVAELKHPHILPALDDGEYGPWYYLVTPYIQHGTLNKRLARGPLTLTDAGEILEQIAGALQFAHEHGVVHRDIKPTNVLMRDDHYAYLADFGLVKSTGTDHSLTQSGYLIGTPEYMAPELVDVPATPASDTYALGILLYQMLAGRVPFKGTTPVSIVWKHLQDTPEPPSKFNVAIPFSVDQVILGALEKDPQKRIATPRDLYQAYQRAMTIEEQTVQVPFASVDEATIQMPQNALPVDIQIVPVSSLSSFSSRIESLSTSRKAAFAAIIVLAFLAIPLLGFAMLGGGNRPPTSAPTVIHTIPTQMTMTPSPTIRARPTVKVTAEPVSQHHQASSKSQHTSSKKHNHN
ncbi:MAG TPA: serine/threonine-protein kinase [Ktedonobacteraceae bacterium]|jgi:serine/threonine protein kinase|nr:serine/threonine-protein kinase [Ktedonobacteraceae bacterium]